MYLVCVFSIRYLEFIIWSMLGGNMLTGSNASSPWLPNSFVRLHCSAVFTCPRTTLDDASICLLQREALALGQLVLCSWRHSIVRIFEAFRRIPSFGSEPELCQSA